MPKQFNVAAYTKGMDALIELARKPLATLEQIAEWGKAEEDFGEDEDLAKLMAEDFMESLRIRVQMALEALGHHDTATRFASEFDRRFAKNPLEFRMLPAVGVMACDAFDFILKYNRIVAELYGEKPASTEKSIKRKFLRQILEGTGKIVADKKLPPQNEAQVRQAIFDLLTHVFSDTAREIPISKQTKTYKPDIGVVSLRTAVEYKFADTLEKAKTLLGGIYEDIHGYAGSRDWTFFYAVIYMTDHFFTKAQVMNELKLADVGKNWEFILITGGDRKGRRCPPSPDGCQGTTARNAR